MPNDGYFGRKVPTCDCCKRTMGFRQVKVGDCCMQIEGLDEVFREYFEKGKTPDDIHMLEMIKEVSTQNFIPEDAEDLYHQALLREYKSYHNARKK